MIRHPNPIHTFVAGLFFFWFKGNINGTRQPKWLSWWQHAYKSFPHFCLHSLRQQSQQIGHKFFIKSTSTNSIYIIIPTNAFGAWDWTTQGLIPFSCFTHPISIDRILLYYYSYNQVKMPPTVRAEVASFEMAKFYIYM